MSQRSDTPEGRAIPRVYVLYTGGTIGMAGSPLAPLSPDDFAALVASQPGFDGRFVTVQLDDDEDSRIEYVLDAFDAPLDSSSMTPQDWLQIAQRLLEHYADCDGMVVLHGTDTMAFTASALSFLLSGLSKPVVVTGAQIPLQQTRNDALRNLVTSIVIAATKPSIVESTLFFDTELQRGNRAEKVNASEFPAFSSPNFPPLAVNGITITVDGELLLKPPKPSESLADVRNRQRRQEELRCWSKAYAAFSIVTLTLFPGIQASTVRAMLSGTRPRVRGVVIEAFGSGNAPANTELMAVLKDAHERGVVLLDITEVLRGVVDLDAYQSASGLKEAGAVSGFDMTPEAALSKLIYLTGLGLDQQQIEQELEENLQGELTEAVRDQVRARWAGVLAERAVYTLI